MVNSAPWRKFQTCLNRSAQKVGLLEITPNHSAAGPNAAMDGQDIPSRNNTGNQEEKLKFCIWWFS